MDHLPTHHTDDLFNLLLIAVIAAVFAAADIDAAQELLSAQAAPVAAMSTVA